MGISEITTRNRNFSSNDFTKHDDEIAYNSTIEIDCHSDTHFFGKNFQFFSSTQQVCVVTSFLDELSPTNNVAIVTSATAMIDDNDAVFIAVFVQEINAIKKIDKGIINPNQ